MRLSIVTTMYRSRDFLAEFHRRATEAALQLTDDFEIVFVNDGSPDDSLDVAIGLHRADPRVVIVDLSRNFGHHRAMMAGLAEARGDLVFLVDVDLEEDPADLIRFHERMQAEKSDVVYGVQTRRKGGMFQRYSGELYYWTVKHVGGAEIPRNLTTSRLMTRRYVQNLLLHTERDAIMSGLWVLTGFKQVAETIDKKQRPGASNYNLARKLRLTLDHVTAFSGRPLYIVFFASLAVFLLAMLATAYFIVRYMFSRSALDGWTSLMSSIWMFGSLNVLLISFVGVYVARIFEETKKRPYVIVRDVYRHGEAGASAAALPSGA